jgi:hypothetical protein
MIERRWRWMSLQFTRFATLTALTAAHPSQRSNDTEPKLFGNISSLDLR